LICVNAENEDPRILSPAEATFVVTENQVKVVEAFQSLQCELGSKYSKGATMESQVQTEIGRRCTELTDRQMEVLKWLVEGVPPKQIALDLHISVHTVNAHLREIYIKLQARGRVDATRWYLSRYYFSSSPP
jgi:DNA-binding CsgD family transcriptional regulator